LLRVPCGRKHRRGSGLSVTHDELLGRSMGVNATVPSCLSVRLLGLFGLLAVLLGVPFDYRSARRSRLGRCGAG